MYPCACAIESVDLNIWTQWRVIKPLEFSTIKSISIQQIPKFPLWIKVVEISRSALPHEAGKEDLDSIMVYRFPHRWCCKSCLLNSGEILAQERLAVELIERCLLPRISPFFFCQKTPVFFVPFFQRFKLSKAMARLLRNSRPQFRFLPGTLPSVILYFLIFSHLGVEIIFADYAGNLPSSRHLYSSWLGGNRPRRFGFQSYHRSELSKLGDWACLGLTVLAGGAQ